MSATATARIDSGELPSAEGVQEGHDLAQVIRHWQSVADGRFRDDCRFLLQMIEETDRLRLWEKNVGGFTYANRDEFLQKKVLIDYDLTERQTRQIVDALRAGKSGGIADLVASVEPASDPHARPGNQNARKKEENAVASSNPVSPRTKGSTKSETIIARLKRDAETDTHAAALLGSIEAGDLKPYRAAVEMGWVKTPDPAVVIEKQREKLEPHEQVRLWEEWGRALPARAYDHVEAAKEALLNLGKDEAQALMTWWQEVAK